MRYFQDGDTICIVDDKFVNLQESPALFVTPVEFDNFISHQKALSRAEVLEEVRGKIEVKIGQCKQPITQSCEYCSALHDIKTIIGEL
jgi:hypothetical protein